MNNNIRYVNKKMVEECINFQYASKTIELEALVRYIGKTGFTEFYFEASDYFGFARSCQPAIKIDGRTENNEPFFTIYGIKIVLFSKERLDKIQALK